MAGKNPNGSGSIRKRSNGTWEARYTVGKNPETGKPIRKSIYGKTQKDVRDKLLDITKDIKDKTFIEPAKVTVGEWLDIFLAEYNSDVKEFTQKSYEVYVNNHLKPTLGAIKLSALTAPMIQKAYNSIFSGDTGKKPLSAKSLKNCHGVLHKALKIAQKVGYIRYNPSDNVTLPKVIKPVIKPLNEDNIERLLSEIRGHQYEDLFIFTLFTGMRQGEVLGLTWDCVDLENKTVKIEKQLIKEKKKGGKYKFAPLKNNKFRYETIPAALCDILRKIREQPQQLLQNDPELGNLVFVNENGNHLCHVTVSKNLKRILRKLGLTENCFHDLRHTYAVVSLQNGDSPKTVQENLGHATAAFTLDVYGGVSDRMKRESANKMDAFISKVNHTPTVPQPEKKA